MNITVDIQLRCITQMALNAQTHSEAVCAAAEFLANELRKYATLCALYLVKSTTGRGNLRQAIIDAYVALLMYAAGIRTMGSHGLGATLKQNLSKASPLEPLRKNVEDADQQVEWHISQVSRESRCCCFQVYVQEMAGCSVLTLTRDGLGFHRGEA